MDLLELLIEFKKNKKQIIYLFSIINNFYKYAIAYILYNKKSDIILKYLKIGFECHGYPDEMGFNNGTEFKNRLIEQYLLENKKIINDAPYNPNSQGVVESYIIH